MSLLFAPMRLGRLQLRNRIVMAPMTRSRAGHGDIPTQLHELYYRQRASAGLIIAEGTQPCADGKGYCRTPGIYTAQQIEAWRHVTDAVHAEGGNIVLQLMHCGRIGHPDNKSPDTRTVAPSAIRAHGQIYTDSKGLQDFVTPQAMTREDIKTVIAQYQQATRNAYDAGFDGVELHCTSGYLPAQFLSTGTNVRDDEYGGSIDKRCRFVIETLQAMSSVDGADRIGIRICPGNPFNDLHDDDPHATFSHLLPEIDRLQLAYLHVIRSPQKNLDAFALAREKFHGALIINDGFDRHSAEQALHDGIGDAVSFGRLFIGNPDLVRRFHDGLPLSGFDHKTLYTPGEKGYTDYPTV